MIAMKKNRVKKDFLDQLKKVPIVLSACEKVGISRQSVYRWRNEDPTFRREMYSAIEEGEDHVNDYVENQLLALIKEKHFNAIRFWLTLRHPKFKKLEAEEFSAQEKEKKDIALIEAMGLTKEDFEEENYDQTIIKILKYQREHGDD